MKNKVKVLLLILCSVFIFTACFNDEEGISLKHTSTSYDIFDYYYNLYLKDYYVNYKEATEHYGTTANDDRLKVRNVNALETKIMKQEVCALAAVDYLENKNIGEDTKLGVYQFEIGNSQYVAKAIFDEQEKKINAATLTIDDECELSGDIVIYRDVKNGVYKYDVTFYIGERTSKADISYDKDTSNLYIKLKTSVEVDGVDDVYQSVTSVKEVRGFKNDINYYFTEYSVGNLTNGQGGGKYLVAGYSYNVESKLKFSAQEQQGVSVDYSNLKLDDLNSFLTSDKYAIIFEKNMASDNAAGRYAWKHSGDESLWTLIG